MTNNSLLLCDDEFLDIDHQGIIVYWKSFKQSSNEHSLPAIVEEKASSLKATYLRWLYDIGHTTINGQSLIDRLRVRPGFSMWWMSLLIEKSNPKSPRIYCCFRLLALDALLQEHKVNEVTIAISDTTVLRAIEQWCRENTIPCRVHPTRKANGRVVNRLSRHRWPHALRAIVTLVSHGIRYGTVRNRHAFESTTTRKELCFISYFNIDQDATKIGQFYTRYWTRLHSSIVDGQRSTSWLHLFVRGKSTPNLKRVNETVGLLNANESGQETHYILENALDAKVLVRAVLDYFKTSKAGLRLRDIGPLFSPNACRFNLWPIFENDWKRSLFGDTAMTNAIYLNMFEEIFRRLPCHEKGFYLMENQAWERALLYSWRQRGNRELVGVAPTVVSGWDLRHFMHANEYDQRQQLALPVPDRVALNGEMAIREYRESGFPRDKIIEVEALRYLYLGSLIRTPRATGEGECLRVLVIGEILPRSTLKLIAMVSLAIGDFPQNVKLLAKPHPACQLTREDWGRLNCGIVERALDEIVDEYDVAITSNQTGAAIDAYMSGKTVLTLLDPETFNLSPIKCFGGVQYFTNPRELAAALEDDEARGRNEIDEQALFIDENIPLWKGLIGSG